MSETKGKLTLEDSIARKKIVSNNEDKVSVHYDVYLTLRKEKDLHLEYTDNEIGFEGAVKITTYVNKFGDDERSSNLLLDFHGKVRCVIVNSILVEYSYETGRLLINKKFFKEEATNIIEVYYYAKYSRSGVGLHWFKDPSDGKEYLYTQFEAYECNLVLPCLDQPDIKSTLKFNLLTHNEWTVLANEYPERSENLMSSNGDVSDFTVEVLSELSLFKDRNINIEVNILNHLVNSVIDKNYKITKFITTPVISNYLYALAAGPYVCFKNKKEFRVPMNVYIRDSLKNCGNADLFMEITMAGINFFEDYFGFNFPFRKYDQIYTPEYNFGAMENVGLVTYNEAYAWKGTPSSSLEIRFCETVLHELSHMWFGNLVTMKWWNDLWLNEAFATFISNLAMALSHEIDDRFRNNAWSQFTNKKSSGYNEDSKITTHPVYCEIKDTDQSQANFDMIVYLKGSSLLKQMYYFVGHDNFGLGLKNYFNKYAWQNTVFENFISVMEHSSNNLKNSAIFDSGIKEDQENLSLSNLSTSWLTKAGLTNITSDLKSELGLITSFDIVQTPVLNEHHNLQTLMIDILFLYDDHTQEEFKRVIITPKERTSLKVFQGKKAPIGVILNHNDWAYVKWTICHSTFEYVSKNYSRLDGVDKVLVLKSIYDKARDGNMSSILFLDAALEFLSTENDSLKIQIILNMISASVHYFIPLEKVGKYCEEMFFKIYEKLSWSLTKISELKKQLEQQSNETLVNELGNYEEISRCYLTNLIGFSVSEKTRKTVHQLLITNKINEVEVPSNILQKANRFSCVKNIFQSKEINLEEKNRLIEEESKNDNNSDLAKRTELGCRASLPCKEQKLKAWEIISNDDKESLHNLASYMSGLIVYDQLDLVSDILVNDFFEIALKLAERNNYHLTSYYFSYCAPRYFSQNKNVLDNCDSYQQKSTNNDLIRNLKELKDDLLRIKKAQDACN